MLAAEKLVIFLGNIRGLKNEFTGVLTGKGVGGGSIIRPEATGYGVVYFVENVGTKNLNFKNKIVSISGSGNVAQYAAEKVISLGVR